MKKHVIKRLDRGGDTEVAEWNPAEQLEIKAAEEVFNELRTGNLAKGFGNHLMYDASDPQETGTELKKFDPQATEIIAVPQAVGG